MSTLRTAAQQALEALESADWYINQLEQIVYSDDDTDTHEERAKVQAAVTALRAALAEPQTTHSAECYKLHHDCAVAEVERLKLLCEEMLSELYVYRASKQLKDAIRARKENP